MKKIYEEITLEIVEFTNESIETAQVSVGNLLPGDVTVDIDGLW